MDAASRWLQSRQKNRHARPRRKSSSRQHHKTITGADWRPPEPPTIPDDERLAAFLGLVDCQPNEVIDAYQLWKDVKPPTAETLQEAESKREMMFGKHKGKQLCEVPSGYLQWCLDVENPTKGMRRFQRQAKEELERRLSRQPKSVSHRPQNDINVELSEAGSAQARLAAAIHEGRYSNE